MTRRLVLASASEPRRRLLEQAGFAPEVMVSGVDEDRIEAPTTIELVGVLARAKADAVANAVAEQPGAENALVVGCDSLFEFGGVALGKAGTTDEAIRRWMEMRGRSGTLYTGHCVIDVGAGRFAEGVGATVVRFASPSTDEIEAYAATGEPLGAAGAFAIEGRAGLFIEGVDGDPSNVIGLSLPLFRRLLGDLGVAVTELWS